ncbi:MAG: response regulator transcription factor [Anaerolineales bacterium]|nr:response regulator transcription factor [Anaerolineales bacterium]
MMKVLIADDHRLMVEGLQNLLSANGIDVIGVAGDGLEAVNLARTLMPDIVLMDLRMPNCDGLTATRLIKTEMPEMRIVILTTSADDRDLFESVRNGASGYLLKSVSGSEVIEALKGLEHGIPPFSPGLAAKIMGEFAKQTSARDEAEPVVRTESYAKEESGRGPGLTPRQREVLALVSQGMSYKEVGAKLGMSTRTVKYHMREIILNLHLKNRAQAMMYAARNDMD